MQHTVHPLHSYGFRVLQLLGLFVYLTGVLAYTDNHAEATPEWIWLDNQPANHQTVYFRQSFDLDHKPSAVKLHATCDNHLTAYVNGEKVFTNDSWSQPQNAAVTSLLRSGTNVIAIEGKNDGSTAGLVAKLTVKNEDEQKTTLLSTDGSWKVAGSVSGHRWNTTGFADGDWNSAYSIGELGVEPWGHIQFTPPPMPAMSTPEGYEVERVYRVASGQGSWVTMTFTPDGKIVASGQKGPLYRITPSSGSESVQVEEMKIRATKPGTNEQGSIIGGAQGLEWTNNSLYAVVNNGNFGLGAGLYRLTDQNEDGNMDHAQLLKQFAHGWERGREHGPHAVRAGPDGNSLYVIVGNNTPPLDVNRSRQPPVWEEDLLLPRISPPSGAEFGWRNGSGKWPEYYPDSVPPTVEIGQSSPTGVTFGYDADFPKKARNALYVGDWSLGRIFAVHLKPDGASYTGTAEDFITGKPLPVTDMDVGPDGALYFITGGRGIQSSLYRVTYTGDGSSPSDSRTISRQKTQTARKARKLRRKLEELHTVEGNMSNDQLNFAWSHLSSSNRFIRYAARIAVENAPVDMWRSQALNASNPQTLIMAQIALARHGQKRDRPRMIDRLSQLEWTSLSLQQKRALLRAYALIFSRMGAPDADRRTAVIKQLNPHFPTGEYTENKELSRVLAYLEAPGVIKKTLQLLKSATTHDQEIHYGYVLRVVEDGWTIDQRKTFLNWTNRAMNYGGGRELTGYVKQIKKRTLNTMSDKEKKTLSSIIEGGGGDGGPEVRTEIVKDWTMEDLLPAVRQSLDGRNFERGRRMFLVAQCAQCHQMNRKGGITGPNLTRVGQRFPPEYILESIIKPSEVISDRYRRSVIKKNNGSTVYGRIVNLYGSTRRSYLQVMTNPMNPSNLTDVNRSNVESIKPADTSSMPPDLINTLNKQEVLDLMAYLISGGDPSHNVFQDR